MSGWNPPPAPGGPPGGYGYAPGPVYGPPPPRRSSGAGLIIGLILGIGLILTLIIVVVVVVIGLGRDHSISTPYSAGGLTRDFTAERESSSQLSQQRSIMRRTTDYKVTDVKTAVYSSGSTRYMFLGGTGDIDPDDLEGQFRSGMNSSTSSGVSTTTIPLADAGGDGEAVCVSVRSTQGLSSLSTAVCAWATESSFGMVTPLPDASSPSSFRSYSYSTVASRMRLLRDDVED